MGSLGTPEETEDTLDEKYILIISRLENNWNTPYKSKWMKEPGTHQPALEGTPMSLSFLQLNKLTKAFVFQTEMVFPQERRERTESYLRVEMENVSAAKCA